MKYALLLYADEADYPGEDSPALAAEMREWEVFTEALVSAGVYLGGEGLLPSATATTIRPGPDGPVTEDGPFAETKEQFGGFYTIDVTDLEAALTWARRVPTEYITVEVRPLLELPG